MDGDGHMVLLHFAPTSRTSLKGGKERRGLIIPIQRTKRLLQSNLTRARQGLIIPVQRAPLTPMTCANLEQAVRLKASMQMRLPCRGHSGPRLLRCRTWPGDKMLAGLL